jgi:hypothetical protein
VIIFIQCATASRRTTRQFKTTAVRFRSSINIATKQVSVQSADYYLLGFDAQHIAQLKNYLIELFCQSNSGKRSGAFDSVRSEGVAAGVVAAQTGTSVAMIEKTYFKFVPGAMQIKLAAIQKARAT